MEAFTTVYTLLGGLGLFIFGMKFMSDGLQAVAGDVIRKIINSLTSNRIMAAGVGLLVTCLIQSSSITTVMTIGFVNAGLMTLAQAIGVVIGANIGTTITGWLISLQISKLALLLVGIGFIPGLFAKTERWQHLGRAILGIGFVYLGMQYLNSAFVPLRDSTSFMSSIAYFTQTTSGAYLASILMGCLLTMVVQSSAAMLGITMALAMAGILPFHTAVAFVLGENIGTTITAILAALNGTANAKRAARAHALMKIAGVVFVYCFFDQFVNLVEAIITMDTAQTDGET